MAFCRSLYNEYDLCLKTILLKIFVLLFSMKRIWSLLETLVYDLFEEAGFSPQKNVRIEGYEIDVFVAYKNQSIVIECKQYEKGELKLRDLIHIWESKNRITRADRVLFVLYGIEISEGDLEFAKGYGIYIWDQNVLKEMQNLVKRNPKGAQTGILLSLNIDVEKFEKKVEYAIDKLELEEDIAISFANGEISEKEAIIRDTYKMFLEADVNGVLEIEDINSPKKLRGLPITIAELFQDLKDNYEKLSRKLNKTMIIVKNGKAETIPQGEIAYLRQSTKQLIYELKKVLEKVEKERIAREEKKMKEKIAREEKEERKRDSQPY